MTGMYVLTFGAIPLLLAALVFAYCSKHHHSPSDWNKTANRKKLPYVSASLTSKRLPYPCLRHLVTADDGDSNSNACCTGVSSTTTATIPHPPRINTVSSVVACDDDEIYSELSNAASCSIYDTEPTYETVVENAYINPVYTSAKYADPAKSRLSKSDIIITSLMSTTNSQVNSYLQNGVWADPKQ